MKDSKVAHIYINYKDHDMSLLRGKSIFKSNEIYDVQDIVPIKDLKQYVQNDFMETVNKKVNEITAQMKIKMEYELGVNSAKIKLELASNFINYIKNLNINVKNFLGREFSVDDPQVMNSIILKIMKLMNEETLTKVFISQKNFDAVVIKIGEPIVSLLGVNTPIGIGHNLSDTQVMVEGSKTVIVSDLEQLLSQYLDNIPKAFEV